MRASSLSALCVLSLGCACGPGARDTALGNGAPPVSSLAASTVDAAVLTIRPQDGRFAPRVTYGTRQLVLNGAGLCEWGIFAIDLYNAALYVERRPATVEEALRADQVIAIHLDFVRDLTGDQLRAAFAASVRATTGDEFESYRSALDELLATMQTARAGESYTFVAEPDRGLLVRRNNRDVATIHDERFRVLFVALYLGDKPPTKALRAALLGDAR